jgi:LysR family hydrogen peroxide-inducible transcriptional activator
MVEFRNMVDKVSNADMETCEVVYQCDRDNWMLAMVASGFGFGFLPKHSVIHDGNHRATARRSRLLAEYSPGGRSVIKSQSHIVAALVHEAIRTELANEDALPVEAYLTVSYFLAVRTIAINLCSLATSTIPC